ncbi:MAG: LLM class flavin-dependent oxidoreductase [Leucobacter sp.]
MRLGIFNSPYAREYAAGRRTAKQVIDWDLQLTRWADEFGIDEAYFAEHHTVGDEPSPAPDAMIAAASQLTERITLGAAAHLLPYHHPVSLAHRMMWLDHMTGGRYIAGVAPGGYPSDWALFGTERGESSNAEMFSEALDLMQLIWAGGGPGGRGGRGGESGGGPFEFRGEHYYADMPAYSEVFKGPHLRPFAPSGIPIMMTGCRCASPTLAEAGRRGALPLSQQVHESVLVTHWQTYAEAAVAAGHSPDRANWKICRDIFVADTDDEARDRVVHGALGRLWSEVNIPSFVNVLGIGPLLTGGEIDPSDLTLEWMLDNFLLVGSPETVIEKAERLYDSVGGFGTLITYTHEYHDEADVYRRHLELLGTRVGPALRGLVP